MNSLIEMMVPFRVKALPLPEEVTIATTRYESESWRANMENKLKEKVWTVVAIRTNPTFRLGGDWSLTEEGFVTRVIKEYGHPYESFPCMLFLLIKDRENPVWWPDKYCEVIDETTS